MPKFRDREKAFFGREMTHGGEGGKRKREGLSIELISSDKQVDFIHYALQRLKNEFPAKIVVECTSTWTDPPVNHPRAIICRTIKGSVSCENLSGPEMDDDAATD